MNTLLPDYYYLLTFYLVCLTSGIFISFRNVVSLLIISFASILTPIKLVIIGQLGLHLWLFFVCTMLLIIGNYLLRNPLTYCYPLFLLILMTPLMDEGIIFFALGYAIAYLVNSKSEPILVPHKKLDIFLSIASLNIIFVLYILSGRS